MICEKGFDVAVAFQILGRRWELLCLPFFDLSPLVSIPIHKIYQIIYNKALFPSRFYALIQFAPLDRKFGRPQNGQRAYHVRPFLLKASPPKPDERTRVPPRRLYFLGSFLLILALSLVPLPPSQKPPLLLPTNTYQYPQVSDFSSLSTGPTSISMVKISHRMANPTVLRSIVLLAATKTTDHPIRMLVRMVRVRIMASIAGKHLRAAAETKPAMRFRIVLTMPVAW